MKVGEYLNDYFLRMVYVANTMQIHTKNLQDVTVMEKILCSLMERFNCIVWSIEEDKNVNRMSIDDLQSSLCMKKDSIDVTEKSKQL